MFFSIFGFAGGMGMPMQTSVNAQLGRRVGSPFIAALINFIVGFIALVILAVIVEHGLAIPMGKVFAAPPWILTGAFFSVMFVTGNIVLLPRIGSVQTTILSALGQIIMGTLIDTFGWFQSATRPMGALRALGVALVFGGVIVIILSKTRSAGAAPVAKTTLPKVKNVWLWRLFGLIVGMGMTSQTAVNAHLSVVVDSKLFASVINFAVGITLLVILNLALLKTKKPGDKSGKAPAWILCGGFFGALFVFGNIITAQAVGTGMAVVIQLTGLMVGGLLVDQFGLFRSAKRPVGYREILGVLIMVAGAAMFHLM